MSEINVEQLLQPISPDSPSGENLEYDPQFLALEQAAQGKPEQQVGDAVVPAEDPDWRTVCKTGLELLSRTKDFRVAVQLARGSLATSGFPGFGDSLALIRGYVQEELWESVHPQLDPDDDNDPTTRVNVLASLFDLETTLRLVDRAELVRAQGLGSFSLRDLAVAKGELPAIEGEEVPDANLIHGAFMESDLEDLQAEAQAVQDAIATVQAIEQGLTERVGPMNAISFEPLVSRLKQVADALAGPLRERGAAQVVAPEGEAGEGQAVTQPGASFTGEVRSRADVIRALDAVCRYYEQNEPSSPVPLLLKRAKRIASKSFLDIIRDLSPKALGEIQAIGGVDEDETS